ncbi:MAG: hypothetical protein WDO18_15020, partial [Acidobacteriota bacterium]
MALVFASGGALGVYGNKYYTDRQAEQSKSKSTRAKFDPDDFRRRYLAGMRKQLSLTDAQIDKLTAILDETRAEMNELQKRQLPEQFQIQRAQDHKIRGIMTAEQLVKYDEMLKRMSERARKNKASTSDSRPDSK